MHVRESHFILTDIPVTALTTLTVWLAVRAGRRRQPGTYMWAGVAAGLAAAAKYNGGIAAGRSRDVWLLHDRSAHDAAARRRPRSPARPSRFSSRHLTPARPAVLPERVRRAVLAVCGVGSPWRPRVVALSQALSLAARYWPLLAMLGAVIVLSAPNAPPTMDAAADLRGDLLLRPVDACADFRPLCVAADSGALPAGFGPGHRAD